jgi:hypothetical protein
MRYHKEEGFAGFLTLKKMEEVWERSRAQWMMKIWSVMAAPSRQGIEYMTQIVRPGFTVLTFLRTVNSRNQRKRPTSNPPPPPPQIPCNVKCMQRCEDEGVFNTWFGSLLNEWSRAHISVALPVRPPILGFHWLLQITNRFSSSSL